MARQDRITTPIRVLCLCVMGLLFGGGIAIADTALRPVASATADDQVSAQAIGGSIAAVAQPVPGVAPATTVAPAPAPTTTAAVAPTTTVVVAPTPAPAPAVTTPPAPRPAPTTTVAPRQEPAPAPAPKRSSDPAERVEAAYRASVPAAWRNAIDVTFELIDGNTSWAQHDGTIQIGSAHYNGTDAALKVTIAHEFGHLIAFRYGSQEFNGAAPTGWPSYSSRPEEAWGDCVARAFTGINDPSHGLPACAGNSLSWTADWVGAGPGAHEVTGY